MSTFKERENLEEKYALPKFEQWLRKRGWDYKRLRFPKELSDIDIDSIPNITEEKKIKLKMDLEKATDFKFDGIMSRKIGLTDAWLFDLKYKNYYPGSPKPVYRWVDQKSYESYFGLSQILPFIIVFVVHNPNHGEDHNRDVMHFHKVRDPMNPPMETDFKGKLVYIVPENEYNRITGFEPDLKSPNSIWDYMKCTKEARRLYKIFREGKAEEQDEETEEKIIGMLKQKDPDLWGETGPVAMKLDQIRERVKDLLRRQE